MKEEKPSRNADKMKADVTENPTTKIRIIEDEAATGELQPPMTSGGKARDVISSLAS